MVNGKSLRVSRAFIFGLAMVGAAAMLFAMHFSTDAGYAYAKTDQPVGSLDLEDGDVVFRTGRDIMARLVLSQGEAPRFSHIGVIVKHNHELFVVHALPNSEPSSGGVLIEPLSAFSSSDNAVDVGFYRLKNIDATSRQQIRAYALRQVGKPFDNEFRFSDDSQFYCTELVLKALAAGNSGILGSLRSLSIMTLSEPVFPPDYLRRSPSLEEMTPG